jgi:hypothetical protein
MLVLSVRIGGNLLPGSATQNGMRELDCVEKGVCAGKED